MEPRQLPTPPGLDAGVTAAIEWVRTHLGDVARAYGGSSIDASARFRGGQHSADLAVSRLDLAGYADRRSEVLPAGARGATGLSPYIRHGLLSLPQLWRTAREAPQRDRDRFRDELLWQEYARHLYARLGHRNAAPLRYVLARSANDHDPWLAGRDREMACLTEVLDELQRDGWAVNQARMWLASHWSVREGADWRAGENRLFQELIDGSRAANRLGWQWTVGTGTGRPYAFSRRQVERRAPGLCTSCTLRDRCPIDAPPDIATPVASQPERLLRVDPQPERTAGPARPLHEAGRPAPQAVWLTAESLGDADPALAARPDLPAIFVFDVPLLTRLRLNPRRLVFLAETLGDLATRRVLDVWRGDVRATLAPAEGAARPLAATFTPVPGWRRLAPQLPVVALHPWPWLRRPHNGRLSSFSAWRGQRPR